MHISLERISQRSHFLYKNSSQIKKHLYKDRLGLESKSTNSNPIETKSAFQFERESRKTMKNQIILYGIKATKISRYNITDQLKMMDSI